MKKQFAINGMSCNHCVANVEKAINQLDGIDKVKINLKKNQGVVKFDDLCQLFCSSREGAESNRRCARGECESGNGKGNRSV